MDIILGIIASIYYILKFVQMKFLFYMEQM